MTVVLAPKYYLEHFEAMLRHVEEHYGTMLTDAERGFIARFRALPEDPRCLFVRMSNRRGLYFRPETLCYAELDAGALDTVLEAGFAEPLTTDHAPEVPQWLSLFKKAEWLSVLEGLGCSGLKRAKKAEIEAEVLAHEPEVVVTEINRRWPVIRVCHSETVEALKFMFFGTLDGHLSEFVVRDVGNIRVEEVDRSRLTPRFASRREVDDCLAVARAYREFRALREIESPDSLFAWVLQWRCARPSLCDEARQTLDRILVKVGRALEREKLDPLAIHAYELSRSAPARERRARVLYRMKEPEAALQVCEEIRAEPRSPEERLFAEDFADRITRKRRRKRTTEALRASEVLTLTVAEDEPVEEAAAAWFRERGFEAVHVENTLWRSLFALVLWDVLFDGGAGALHHPLQRAPSDLYTRVFLERRSEAIDSALASLRDRRRGRAVLERRYREKKGVAAAFMSWDEALRKVIFEAYARLTPRQLRTVIREMARDLKHNGAGFPDLAVWNAQIFELVEIKSENDTLSAAQLHWLQVFRSAGISARVLRVERQVCASCSSKIDLAGS